MDFSLTDEQNLFYDQVYKFARKELNLPFEELNEYDHNQIWPKNLWKKLADFGLLALPFPEKYGGGNADAVTICLAKEAAAKGGLNGGTSLAWGAHSILCGIPILKLGTDEQKEKYIRGICTGETIGGFALTEPGSGSDAAAMKTRAVKDGDHYVLNGTKMFITNGPIGSVFIVLAVTDPDAKHFGISAFIVEKDFPGFSVGKELNKMGVRTSKTSELIFQECRVPKENLLGNEGAGFLEVGKLTLGWERGTLIAQGVGGMEYMLKKISRYALEREQFGKPIAEFGAIKEKIANVRIWCEVSRQLVRRIAWMLDNNKECLLEAAVAKEYLSQKLVRASEECVQIFGGYGFMKEYMVEQFYRDAKLATIGAGTSEIQKGLIARAIMNIS